jgi:hypothetical protein
MGLEIDATTYYNLRTEDAVRSLNQYDEARLLLKELEGRKVHVAVKEQYVLDSDGNKGDRVIQCIVWWTSEQIRMARRFVSDMLAETDATFNTNEKRLLLQCFVGIDNTGHTFQFLQAFTTAESADIVKFLLQTLEDHFFYDCPGFAVLASDFGAGVNAGFVRKATQDVARAEAAAMRKGKEIDRQRSPDELPVDYDDEYNDDDPLRPDNDDDPLRPDNDDDPLQPEPRLDGPDSQTIIVDSDPIRAIQPTLIGVNNEKVVLQFCTWHAAEAIKRKLISKGYKKEHREELNNLIWKWIKAPDLDALETARNTLVLSLKNDEKEYLTAYYQPKEPQFCHAYTCHYRNLGIHSTGRVERNHYTVSSNLHKNLKVIDSVERICKRLETMAADHEENLANSRISDLRLGDSAFFALVQRRITLYALEKCNDELLKAKQLFKQAGLDEEVRSFNPEFGCQDECELPLRYRLPCKHWMLYFLLLDQPIPLNLFHPRWLIDGPSVVYERWQIRLDNHDYSEGEQGVNEGRITGDRSADNGKQLIIDTSRTMVIRHQNLPPGEKDSFALAFSKMADNFLERYDDRLNRLNEHPRRLPDPLLQPKLTYGPGRKRALTGAEAAARQEMEAGFERVRAEKRSRVQAQNDARQAEHAAELSQGQAELAEEYAQGRFDVIPRLKKAQSIQAKLSDDDDSNGNGYEHSSQPKRQVEGIEAIDISSNQSSDLSADSDTQSNDDSDEFEDIDVVLARGPASTAPVAGSSKQRQQEPLPLPPPPTAPLARPSRARKPTSKQASQIRRKLEKEGIKKAKRSKKVETVDLTQDDEFSLPFGTSQ